MDHDVEDAEDATEGQARERVGQSWAEFHPPILRFMPLNPRNGAELAFPGKFRGMARVWYGLWIRVRAGRDLGQPEMGEEVRKRE